ncbi:MAG: polysaccharide biosynthesis C-terminal domain-containing protein, partial [Acutalibacteraceae bacterium]|nr:polysaccharide biosynthesis C-terminal domain-containing protein [Acutalibacteraceae bacterium]
AVMFLAGGVIIAFAKPAIKILSTEQYYSAWQYVPLLSAAMIFTAFASFTGTVYVVTKKSGLSFITSMAGAAINIALNVLLIPSPLGVQGAAIATFLSYFAVFLIRAVNSRKYIPFKLYGGHIALNTALIMVQIVFLVLELPLWIPVQAVCLIALAVTNFKFVLPFLKKILSAVKKLNIRRKKIELF